MLSPLEKLERLEQADVSGGEPDRGPYQELYSGTRFYPLNPREEDIHIEDIAHALAYTCRYGGHCKYFYSVAEHSYLLTRYARDVQQRSPQDQLRALLDDAVEGYIGDVTRPIKLAFPMIKKQIETPIERVIMRTFGLPEKKPVWLRELDQRIIVDERAQVMRSTENEWAHDELPALGVTILCWNPSRAEQQFLATYYRLQEELSHDG